MRFDIVVVEFGFFKLEQDVTKGEDATKWNLKVEILELFDMQKLQIATVCGIEAERLPKDAFLQVLTILRWVSKSGMHPAQPVYEDSEPEPKGPNITQVVEWRAPIHLQFGHS